MQSSVYTDCPACPYKLERACRWIRVDPAASVLLGSAVWLVVSFAPSAGVLVDPGSQLHLLLCPDIALLIGTTIAERLLYMPSAGLY